MPEITMGETNSPASTTVVRQMAESTDQDLRTWIESLGAGDSIEIKVYRTEPERYKNMSIKGYLCTYNEPITEERIADDYGGGKYQLKIRRPDKNGSMQYFKHKTVNLPGPPKIDQYDDRQESASARASEDPTLASQALDTMRGLLDDVKKGNGNSGLDVNLIRTLMEPVQAQIEQMRDANHSLQEALAQKETRMLELLTQKPDTSRSDALLEKVWDSESRRIEALRENHDSEIRQLRENHREDIKRLEARHENDIRDRERSREREIENLQRSLQTQVDSNKIAYESRIDGLKSEIERLNRELTEAKTEMGELRARKEKSLTDQAAEIIQIQDAFKSLGIGGGSGDEEDNRKWYEKLASTIVENPEAIGQLLGAKPPEDPSAQQQQLPQQAMPPVGMPFEAPDGNVYVRQADNSLVPYQPPRKKKAAKKAPEKPGVRAPDAGEVAIAIKFIEGAAANGTDPEVFANSFRSSIPAEILAYIEEQGVDEFMDKVAKLEPNSPLRTQAGRNFVRSVGKCLLQGTAS